MNSPHYLKYKETIKAYQERNADKIKEYRLKKAQQQKDERMKAIALQYLKSKNIL
jgi:hypothetical protein